MGKKRQEREKQERRGRKGKNRKIGIKENDNNYKKNVKGGIVQEEKGKGDEKK